MLAIAVAAGMPPGVAQVQRAVQRYVRHSIVTEIPRRLPCRWPQEALQAAILRILPQLPPRVKFPFIEDIVNVGPFSSFFEWQGRDEFPAWRALPPAWNFIKSPAWARLSEGRQDGVLASGRAAPPIVSFGLDADTHYSVATTAARNNGFPMDSAMASDFDMDFAAEQTVKHRASLRKYSKTCIGPLRELATRLTPLNDALLELQPPSVSTVAGEMHVAFMATLIILM